MITPIAIMTLQGQTEETQIAIMILQDQTAEAHIEIRVLQNQTMDTNIVLSQAMKINSHMVKIIMEILIMMHIKKDSLTKIQLEGIVMAIQYIIKLLINLILKYKQIT
jgi:hypothetical protein